MLSSRIVSRCAVSRAIALVCFGAVTACSGGDPASPSLPGTETASDAGAGALADQALDTADAGICPRDWPDACPLPAPSWMNSVRIIVEERCAPCHFPGGVDDVTHDYSNYQNDHNGSGSIFSSVAGCHMPPADSGPLTHAERETLFAWLVCGAPDN